MIGFTGAQGWLARHIEQNEVESLGQVTPKFIKVNFSGQTTTQPPAASPIDPFGLNDKHGSSELIPTAQTTCMASWRNRISNG